MEANFQYKTRVVVVASAPGLVEQGKIVEAGVVVVLSIGGRGGGKDKVLLLVVVVL
jgi:hypothetical protein